LVWSVYFQSPLEEAVSKAMNHCKSSCRSITLCGSTNEEGIIRWLMHLATSKLTW